MTEEKKNIERYENRLARLVARLEEEGKEANQRVQFAVEDCLDPDIDNKLRTQLYNGVRATATKYGYADYLPAQGERGASSVIQPTLDGAETSISNFVRAGLQEAPEVLAYLRRKKNRNGVIYYTTDSLIQWLTKSTTKRLEDDHKENVADNNLQPLLDAYAAHLEAEANTEATTEE